MKVWFVAAGTGGHIFPGITLAKEILEKHPDTRFLFFGTRDRLEATLIPAEKFPIKFLVTPRWKGGPKLLRLLSLPLVAVGVFQVLTEILEEKPKFLVSIGGYISVPVVIICAIFNVPIFLVEPNIRAGLANRLLSRFVRLGFSTPGSDSREVFHSPVLELGNPIRKDILKCEIRPEVKFISVLGGSQGSVKLGRSVLEIFSRLKLGQNHGITLLVQTGKLHLEELKTFAQECEVDAWTQIVPFVNDVPKLLQKTDVMVSRAGAMSVAEISAAALPTIFVPYPFAADDHQNQNAKLLEKPGAALRVDEREGDFIQKLESALKLLVIDSGNVVRRSELSDQLFKFGKPKATEEIVGQILSQV